MIPFASPELLSLYAVAAEGDPDLVDGTHVRFVPSDLLGLPIAPWLVWQAPLMAAAMPGSAWKTAKRYDVATVPNDREFRYVAAEAIGAGGPLTISILDVQDLRLVTRRSLSRYVVGAPAVERVRLEGAVGGASVRVYGLHQKMLVDFARDAKLVAKLALPIEGECFWYENGVSRDEGLYRAKKGAPRRFPPLDRPDGPFDPLDPGSEADRVAAGAGEVDRALESLLRAPAVEPWNVRRTEFGPGLNEQASFDEMDSVHVASCDPGLARYLGFSDQIGVLKSSNRDIPCVGLIGAGLFAVDPERVIEQRAFGPFTLVTRMKDRLPPLGPDEKAFMEFVVKQAGAERVVERLSAKGFEIRCFAAPAAAVPPPDLPVPPAVLLRSASWILREGGVATMFRQGFSLPIEGVAPLVAMAKLRKDGRFEPLAREAPGVAERHFPMLIGTADGGEGIVSHAPVQADFDNVFRFNVGDLFGRYGDPADIAVPDPARPAPPAPAPRTYVRRALLDDQASVPLSAGTLEVRVASPDVDSIGAGGRAIAKLTLSFAGETRSRAVDGAELFEAFALPPLGPQQPGSWPLEAWFVDDHGAASPVSAQAISIVDPRRPKPIVSGPAIIWTSRPGPSPDVELRLGWEGAPGQAYRAWIADQDGLGLARAPTRAAVAVAGYQKQRAGGLAPLADRFRLLTDIPITAGPDGRARLETTLPRTLSTVNFLRVVPETPEGVTADFDACDVTPVAVPDDRPPPPPRLTVSETDGGGARLTIEAMGFDMDAIAAQEPGLFATPPRPGPQPEFRLRRASGPVEDPLYARRLTGASALRLDRDDPGGPRFVATFDDGDLIPFVRHLWWAEVRLPAERRLPEGVLLVAGDFAPDNAGQSQDAPRPFSPLSAPAALTPAPKDPPAALEAGNVTAEVLASGAAGRVRLTVADAPVAHAQAIAPYLLRVWIRAEDGDPQRAADAPVTAEIFTTEIEAAIDDGATARVWIAVVDPLGRESPTIEVAATV
ncbi:MAG: hypothetical protein DI565_09230 [Ancylobacter novellus]|uniref:Uncharacterized protein n=1 Tax=Ancylobacter novellus TaxID=921 RepID=A0A2W5KG99_ANCNO|nr:MAG: hypothetical protein DI565_09230 [Ancylobacter novellus]